MLEAISNKLCAELAAQGIRAVAAYPNADIPRNEPVVAVSLKNAGISGGGFGDYMGLDDSGEVYGLMCDAKFELDICSDVEGGYSALARECDRLIAAVWELSGGFGALSLGECVYDRALCCLRCRGALGARFWLTRGGSDGEILDFTVKGMILHGNE